MTQGEGSIWNGTGYQDGNNTTQNYDRWGDYSTMSVDPADGCTFWYTNEYVNDTGGTWYLRTRIGAFQLAGCTIANNAFEKGDLSGWTVSGTASATSAVSHSGTYAARLSGNSSIAQDFTLPAGATRLSFWYEAACPDHVSGDGAKVSLSDDTAGTATVSLPATCTDTGSWQHVTVPVTGGHHYALVLRNTDNSHDAAHPTTTAYDDITFS
jgi:hypothetical protein